MLVSKVEKKGRTRDAVDEVILWLTELEQQFGAFVAQTNKSKVVVQKALDEERMLFDSLMQLYFR